MGHCRSDIEQAVDQDSGKMQARLKYIAIEQLVHYAGKKVKPSPLVVGTSIPTLVGRRGSRSLPI